MSHYDVTVPPVSNPERSVNISGWRTTIVLSHGFAKRSLRSAQEGKHTAGQTKHMMYVCKNTSGVGW